MGTNFFVDDDPTCNNPAHTQRLHIGKSSGGWKFLFHAIPEHTPPLNSWAVWREFLAGREIGDEYGRDLTLEDFVERVEKRPAPKGLDQPKCHVEETRAYRGHRDERQFHDAEGYDFYDGEFS